MARRRSSGLQAYQSRSNGLRAALWEQFGDNRWYSREEVVAGVGHLIPVDIAIRELDRSHGLNRFNLPEEYDSAVDAGRAYVIHHALAGMGGEFDQRGNDRRKTTHFRLDGTKRRHSGQRLLTDEDVRNIRVRYAGGGITMKKIALEYGVAPSTVPAIIGGKTWKHVT